MLVTPVSAERGEWSVTIERLVVNPDKTDLVFALTGPAGAPAVGPGPLEPPPWTHLPVSLHAGDQTLELTNEGRQGGSEMSAGYGSTRRQFRPTLRFPPLAAGTDELEVVLDGPPGNWAIPLTLTPTTVYGLRAQPLELTDVHHGVTLTARAIAWSESMTAIDVHATLDPTPQPRFMRSLGVARHGRREESEFTLTDDTGQEVREFARSWQGGSTRRHSRRVGSKEGSTLRFVRCADAESAAFPRKTLSRRRDSDPGPAVLRSACRHARLTEFPHAQARADPPSTALFRPNCCTDCCTTILLRHRLAPGLPIPRT